MGSGCSSCSARLFTAAAWPGSLLRGARTLTSTQTHPCTRHSCKSMNARERTCPPARGGYGGAPCTERCPRLPADTHAGVHVRTDTHTRTAHRPAQTPSGLLPRPAQGHSPAAFSHRSTPEPPACVHMDLALTLEPSPLAGPSEGAIEDLPAWQLWTGNGHTGRGTHTVVGVEQRAIAAQRRWRLNLVSPGKASWRGRPWKEDALKNLPVLLKPGEIFQCLRKQQ